MIAEIIPFPKRHAAEPPRRQPAKVRAADAAVQKMAAEDYQLAIAARDFFLRAIASEEKKLP